MLLLNILSCENRQIVATGFYSDHINVILLDCLPQILFGSFMDTLPIAKQKKIQESFKINYLNLTFSRSRRILKSQLLIDNSLVIRQKGESQKGCFKKTKHAKFFQKRTFFTP